MNQFVCCLCFLLSSFSLYSQNNVLNGYIKDQSTGEVLIGATVYNQTNQSSSVTNVYGYYSIALEEGENELLIAYIGYVTVSITIESSEAEQRNIELVPENLELESVIIEATDETLKIQNTEMSVHKLTSETIKNIPVVLGEVDLIKSIELLPGVTTNGEGANGFNVRGGAEDQNLVLLDEAVVYNTAHLFGFFSVFNNDVVKDVQLYKGGIPAKYGGRASSVLDVRQKDGNDKELHGQGGIGLISSRALVEAPIKKDKGSFVVAGRTSYAHLFLNFTDINNDVRFYDLNAKASYEIDEKNKLFLSGYFGSDVFKLADFFENEYGNTTANLRWNHVYNKKLFSNLSAIYSSYRYNLDFSTFDFDWQSTIKNTNVKYDFTWFASPGMDVDFGVNAILYDFNPGVVRPTSETSDINFRQLDQKQALEGGVYISANQDLTEKLTAEYGLRYSSFFRKKQELSIYENDLPVVYNPVRGVYEEGEIIGSQTSGASFHVLEPRFSLAYQINNESAAKISYNRIAQYLHLISNTTTPTPLDVWTPSGTFFEPQMANQVAAGYFRNFEENKYSIELEGYYKTIANRLDYIDGADLIANNEIESVTLPGEMRAYGAELLVRKNKGDLTGWVAYTLAKAEQRTPGGQAGGLGINDGNWYRTNFDRTHDISITSSYELSPKWSFASNFVFQSGRPVTYPDGQYLFNGISVANFTPRNSNRLPAYHRLDFSATLNPNPEKTKKIDGEWVFSIYNAYNRQNANSIRFAQNLETGRNEATRLTIFGMVPSVTWNFKF